MDRFIELVDNLIIDLKNTLKSNMDRFIVSAHLKAMNPTITLKSNMDRFIDQLNCNQFI